MKNFICRGKKYGGDEWVEGYLIQAKEFCAILEDEDKVDSFDYPYLDMSTGAIDGYVTPVNPFTVGRYTHFDDLNGKKIFEGDIVERVRVDTGTVERMYVTWHRGSWMLWDFDGDEDFLWNWIAEHVHKGVHCEGCTVVGNVYDNKDLLEVKEDGYSTL